MSNVRTVSDTKRSFYSLHTRPIASIYRRVVEELMVEMHLLSVNVDFSYDPVYALGVVTAFDRFMQGYRPEQDKISIFEALCRSTESDPHVYRQDAERLKADTQNVSKEDLQKSLESLPDAPDNALKSQLQDILNRESFKYSRLFAIGLYTLLEQIDPDIVEDEKRLNDVLKKLTQILNLSEDKLEKDLEIYRSNLEKLTQAQEVLNDILQSDRKKREQRQQASSSSQTEETLTTPEAQES